MQRALSSPTVSELLVENPSAAPAESLDPPDPGQSEIPPEMQSEILKGSSQDGLTVESNQHTVPSPHHLDTDDAPMMCSPPFQDSPPSSFCSPLQTESQESSRTTAESPTEPSVQLQDTFEGQDTHLHQDSHELPGSKWHIHPPTSQPPAQLQISVPVPHQQQWQKQQSSAAAVSVALNGDNSVSPQQTHSSECQQRPPPATSLSSAASLLTPVSPAAELTAALVTERNLPILDTPSTQSSQQSGTKVLKPPLQQNSQRTKTITSIRLHKLTIFLPIIFRSSGV